jgi:hypothetical protein
MNRRSLGDALRQPGTIRALWAAAGVCFVLLVGAVAFKEARRSTACVGPPRAEADAFTRSLVTGGRDAAFGHLADYARPLVGSIPDLRRARPAEIRAILATGRRNAPGCVYFRAAPSPVGARVGPCFGYELPERLVTSEDPSRSGITVTVVCESGAWRIDGFL